MFDLYFLTSNRVKFDHVKHLLSAYNINLLPAIDYGRPYIEPRVHDREFLLKASVDSANLRLARNHYIDQSDSIFANEEKLDANEIAKVYQNKFFIIEDTSVIIEALSEQGEFPGVDVKYWMKSTSFSSLNETLLDNHNNRNVKVRSDVVLYIPAKFRDDFEHYFKIFTGITDGKIVEEEQSFQTNSFYPWLDNKTFNKWFAPGGEKISISLLPIQTAMNYDFRKKAVDSLIDFLKSLGLLEKKPLLPENYPTQNSLFDSCSLIVCGPTCAGKSLLASYLSRNFGFYHIEASDFMYLAYHQKYGYANDIDIHNFAKQALIDNPLIVSNQVIAHINENRINQFVITGFRSPKELEPVRSSNLPIIVLFIDADFNLRFQRNLARARSDASKSIEKFRERDDKQLEMGVREIENVSHLRIENNQSVRAYFYSVKNAYLKSSKARKSKLELPLRINKKILNLDFSIMLALLINYKDTNEFLTTNDISNLINEHLSEYRKRPNGNAIVTSKNNVSRYFNQKLQAFFEVDTNTNVNKFRLSITGISRALRIYGSIIKR